MSESSRHPGSIKRNSSLMLSSIIKKVILEEASDNSDILNSLTQYRTILESIQTTQDKALAHAIMLNSRPPQVQHPMVLEIVPPTLKTATTGPEVQVPDRRKIKLKKRIAAPVNNSKIMVNDSDDKAVQDKMQKENSNTNFDENLASHSQPTMDLQAVDRLGLSLLESDGHDEENVYFPILSVDPSHSDGGESMALQQPTMIEIQDEDHNQIILPPELQQPILQLLSTRGANLRKITFTHNDVIQTIEIVPPGDGNSAGDEGTHLILTPGGLSQNIIEGHSEQP